MLKTQNRRLVRKRIEKKNSEWLLWNRLVGRDSVGKKHTKRTRECIIKYVVLYRYIESVRVFVHAALRSHVGKPAKKKIKFQGQAGFLEIIRRLRCRAVVISSHFIVSRRDAVWRPRYTNTMRSGNLPRIGYRARENATRARR